MKQPDDFKSLAEKLWFPEGPMAFKDAAVRVTDCR
jgi:hypothetical protein